MYRVKIEGLQDRLNSEKRLKLAILANILKTINWVNVLSFSPSLENQKIHPANDFGDFCRKIGARFENRENHIWSEFLGVILYYGFG